MIDRQQGGGGTELYRALKKSLFLPRDEKYSRTGLIVTDGYISAEKKVFHLIQNNLNRTNFFSFGIGSGVNRYLIEGMAKAGLGEPFIVTKPQDARRMAHKFQEYVQTPVLTHVSVKYHGFETFDIEPPAIPDLFAKRPIIVFGKWRGKLKGTIELLGEGGQGEYIRTFSVAARIYQLVKTRVDMHFYITDASGKLIFNSENMEYIGADYSNWRDVRLTLDGKYGARASLKDPKIKTSSVLYVAAPILVYGEIAGVLTMAKPTTNINNFLGGAKPQIARLGLFSMLATMLLSLFASIWITRPIKRLNRGVIS